MFTPIDRLYILFIHFLQNVLFCYTFLFANLSFSFTIQAFGGVCQKSVTIRSTSNQL